MYPLFIACAVVNFILMLIMVFFYLRSNNYPGFGHWTAGGGCIALGYLMIVFRGTIPVPISIVIQNFSFPLAGILYLSGMKRFLGLKEMFGGWYALPVVSALVSGFSIFFFDSAPLRAITMSLTFSVPHFLTSFVVFKNYHAIRSTFSLILGLEMALMSTVVIIWGIWTFITFGFQIFTGNPFQTGFFVTTMAFQIVITFSYIMLNTERFNRDLLKAEAALRENVEHLEKSLVEVRTLRGLLSICANCKKIRDDHGNWVQVEVYVRDRTHADFSHSVCPECAKKLYPDLYKGK